MTADERVYGERLWAEIIADRLSTASVQIVHQLDVPITIDEWSSPIPKPYVYIIAIILFDIFVLHIIQQLTVGRNTVIDNPSWLALPALVLLAVFTNRYARDRYDEALQTIRIATRIPEKPTAFQRLVPISFKRGLFIAAVGSYYVYLVATGRISTIVRYEGLAGLFGWLIIIPFGYAPVLVETAAMYISLHISFPLQFEAAEVELFYLDPHNLGGLRPVGELLKHSYYLFTVGVMLVTVLLYAPFVLSKYLYTPYQPPEWFITVIVTALWGFGVFSIGFSILVLHRYMRKQRRQELRSLESNLYELVENPYDMEQLFDNEDVLQRFERERHRIELVRGTNEYPATITMWVQILISVVLPLAFQRILQLLVDVF